MHQWALPTIAVMLLAYGAVSGRLRSTPVSQAMVFVALGLLVGNRALGLVEVDTDAILAVARHALDEMGVNPLAELSEFVDRLESGDDLVIGSPALTLTISALSSTGITTEAIPNSSGE
jgi:hypothetical protein